MSIAKCLKDLETNGLAWPGVAPNWAPYAKTKRTKKAITA